MNVDPTAPGARAHARRHRPRVRPEGWEPFSNAPESTRRRYRGLIARAHAEPMRAIELFCIECQGYSPQEAAKCACLSCPLYAFNRRTFDGRACADQTGGALKPKAVSTVGRSTSSQTGSSAEGGAAGGPR